MRGLLRVLVSLLVLCAFTVMTVGLAAQRQGSSAATPQELVATYDRLADAILAVKNTEANLVRSILGSNYAHAQAARERALGAVRSNDRAAARSAIEELAARVAQLGAEGDNAVAGIRKRLIEGGHHHNAEGERKGIYDPGYVIVTRAAKRDFLMASRAIGQLASSPDAEALSREWKKVAAAWALLMKPAK